MWLWGTILLVVAVVAAVVIVVDRRRGAIGLRGGTSTSPRAAG